jgi:hypothetical protein
MAYGASKRISTSFGSVATTEDGILYSSAIDDDDDWSSPPFDEEALVERKHLFVLLLLIGDEVVASEDESMRSDVAVHMTKVELFSFWTQRSSAWKKIFNILTNFNAKCISNTAYNTTTTLVSRARISSSLDD